MGRKRKIAPKCSQSAEPPLKHHQPEPENVVHEYEEVEEEVEEEEVEEEVEEEEDDEEEEEEEEDEEEEDQQQRQEDEDDDPISKLLEPLSKDQILNLLCEAAAEHRDVADRIRKMADVDPVHRKIFVHGLGWDTTAGTLISAFRQYGEIEDCKAVTDKVSGKSKGYGFILFKTRRGARNALKEPQKKIGNRMTACQLASIGPVSNSQSQPQAPVSSVPAPLSSFTEYTQRKIYVSNVGAELDPQKLLAFFSRFGEIEEGPLGLDKVTGKPKGFCLFVYRSAESARRSLEEPHKDFEGHLLHCQKAIDGPKPGKLPQPQGNVIVAAQRAQFQRNDAANAGYVGGASMAQPGHLMAPAGPVMGLNQAAAAQAALNPALGQALTALLASQGTLGLTNLLGSIGTSGAVNPSSVPSAGAAVHSAYNAQPNLSPSVIGGYGNQVGLQVAYPNQQMGQGGSGRGQYGSGGAAPYM